LVAGSKADAKNCFGACFKLATSHGFVSACRDELARLIDDIIRPSNDWLACIVLRLGDLLNGAPLPHRSNLEIAWSAAHG
jgi:hypothetical protein